VYVNGNLDWMYKAFASVGWFIPPNVAIGVLQPIAKNIVEHGPAFGQAKLEFALVEVYSVHRLAAMVLHRYPEVPIIKDYGEAIAESVDAHFLGLRHVAVSGLLPVVEGAGRRLLASRQNSHAPLRKMKITKVFKCLAEGCIKEAWQRGIGHPGEIESMMKAFSEFAGDFLYVDSGLCAGDDRTNRHGILHGAYTDDKYGTPLNFYKTLGAVDFLALVSSFRAKVSWFVPDSTSESLALATRYGLLKNLALANLPSPPSSRAAPGE